METVTEFHDNKSILSLLKQPSKERIVPEMPGRIAARARQRTDLGIIGLPKQKLTALVEIADRVDSKHVVTLEVQQQ